MIVDGSVTSAKEKNLLASLGRKRPHEDKITFSHLYRK